MITPAQLTKLFADFQTALIERSNAQVSAAQALEAAQIDLAAKQAALALAQTVNDNAQQVNTTATSGVVTLATALADAEKAGDVSVFYSEAGINPT